MDEMLRQKSRIEAELQKLKSIQSDREFTASQLSRRIRDLAPSYSKKCEETRQLKAELCARQRDCDRLREMVERYKAGRRKDLAGRHAAGIRDALGQINAIDFPLKVAVFKRLDRLKDISTAEYPILDAKKRELLCAKKARLGAYIIERIGEAAQDKALLNELVFHINFAVRFEAYFGERIFIGFICSLIEGKFAFHFMSNRESNRLDKPEWMFEFLLDKYHEMEHIFKIYADSYARQSGTPASYGELVVETQSLVELKIAELARCESGQRRALIFHFASEYLRFREALSASYGMRVRSTDLGLILHQTQRLFAREELERIHELKYVQWPLGYQSLCKDCLTYISRFHALDPSFRLYSLTKLIATHTQTFLENLSFTSREEVRIACFVYTQVLELRAHIGEVEGALLLEKTSQLPEDEAQKSLSRLSALAADILKLIRSLARRDILAATRSLRHFNYISAEDRRAAAVEIYRIVEDFKGCADYDRVEAEVLGCLDRFVLDDILLGIRFSSDEYLEFREFFLAIKKYFGTASWAADEGCRAVEALLEGKRLSGDVYKKVRVLYGGS